MDSTDNEDFTSNSDPSFDSVNKSKDVSHNELVLVLTIRKGAWKYRVAKTINWNCHIQRDRYSTEASDHFTLSWPRGYQKKREILLSASRWLLIMYRNWGPLTFCTGMSLSYKWNPSMPNNALEGCETYWYCPNGDRWNVGIPAYHATSVCVGLSCLWQDKEELEV